MKVTQFGPYHRQERTAEIAFQIASSGELWGKEPIGSNTPQVQAHVGPLPQSLLGIEFHTGVKPSPGTPPHEVRWRPGSPGVREEDGWAKISVIVTIRTQV